MAGRAVEHGKGDGFSLGMLACQHGVIPTASVFAAEKCIPKGARLPRRLEGQGLLLGTVKYAEHGAERLHLSCRIVAEHPGEPPVGGEKGAVEAEEAKSHRSPIGERTQQRFSRPECILDAATCSHGFLEVNDLLAQAGDLVDQLLLRTVFVTHRKM